MILQAGQATQIISKRGFMPLKEAQKAQKWLDKREWTGEQGYWVDRKGNRVDFSY